MIKRIKEHKVVSIILLVFFLIALSLGTSAVIGYLFICGVIGGLIFFWKKVSGGKKRKIKSDTTFKSDDGLITVKMTKYEDEYKPLPPIDDQRKAKCPYCEKNLDKVPGRKKKCPYCGKYMYVRTGVDRIRKVVTEKEAKEIDMLKIAQPYIEDGSFEKEKARLRKQFGGEPNTGDVLWGLYNQERMKHATEGNRGLYSNTTHQMAEQLERDNKLKGALKLYCEVCFYDLNGATNSGGYGPPFDPEQAFLANQAQSIFKIATELKLKSSVVKEIFIDHVSTIYNPKHMEVNPENAWNQVKNKQ